MLWLGGKSEWKVFTLRSCPQYTGEIWKRKFHSGKASNVFRSHYENARNNHWSLWIYVWGKFAQGNHLIIVTPLFSKCYPSTRKRKAGVFKFLRFEERFRKAPFSWRISVDGMSNRRNKASFSNSSDLVWTLPNCFTLQLKFYQENISLGSIHLLRPK